MLSEIQLIRQLGWFQHLIPDNLPNSGKLKKINLIYAPNGSGKTSLSTIFQSIATNDKGLIIKKRNRVANHLPEFKLLFENTLVSFDGEKLIAPAEIRNRIRIFNSYFIGDNIHTFKIESNGFLIQNMLSDDDRDHGELLRKQLKNIYKNRIKLNHHIKNLKSEKKKYSEKSKKYKEFEKLIDKKVSIRNKLQKKFDNTQDKLRNIYSPYLDNLEVKVNEILLEFNVDFYINVSKTVYQSIGDEESGRFVIIPRLIFDVIFSNSQNTPLIINSDSQTRDSLDYVLSDGDKSALTFALYLSLLELEISKGNQIVFVDDPFSSLDSERRFMTIQYLVKLAEKTSQLIVTSHDEHFLEELYSELITYQFDVNNDILSLGIQKSSNEYSKFVMREDVFLKDNLEVTYGEFIKFVTQSNEITDKSKLRDISMKIRPFLERIFKIKYPEFYVANQTWLKNYLDFIKKSSNDERYRDFKKLLPEIDTFREVLSYTRHFNHDDRQNFYQTLRYKQTKQMIEKTLYLFKLI